MAYRVYIINNETGEGRWSEQAFDWDDKDDFLWTEGNYGCDCNRALFWARAGGEGDIDIECGEERFTVPYAELPDGTRVRIDSASDKQETK